MLYTKKINEVRAGDIGIVGGKGASLGEMMGVGISVPHGYIICANSFEICLKVNGLHDDIEKYLRNTDKESIDSIYFASNRIQSKINQAFIIPEIAEEVESEYHKLGVDFVAVRSSATLEDGAKDAWAGQLDTYLNIRKDRLLEHVKKCWASLFNPRAILYRHEKGLFDVPISIAVIVQSMVNSEESGIAFSVHPVTQDPNQIIIEAGFGLGEAVVSGEITPNTYIFEKDLQRVIEKNISVQKKALIRNRKGGNIWQGLGEKGMKSVLSNSEITELAGIVQKIEMHCGFPCDIEWAKEKGQFFITQTRPITTLNE